MSEQILGEINDSLRRLVRLTALKMVNGLPQRDQISLLSHSGFSPKEIAELVGTSANTVSVELSRKRREKAK